MFVIMIIMLIDDNNQCTGDFGGAGREVSLHPCHRSYEVMLERLLSGYVDVNADLISDCEESTDELIKNKSRATHQQLNRAKPNGPKK